jgi:hypothetical protein
VVTSIFFRKTMAVTPVVHAGVFQELCQQRRGVAGAERAQNPRFWMKKGSPGARVSELWESRLRNS